MRGYSATLTSVSKGRGGFESISLDRSEPITLPLEHLKKRKTTMKRCQTLLFVILLCCVYVIGCNGRQQMVETAVESLVEEEILVEVSLIPDANLAAAVHETLGLMTEVPLTIEVLQTLRTLSARDRQIVDLTGLEYATNLTSLNLGKSWDSDAPNRLSDVSPLANLTSLTVLGLSTNQISNVSPLANLTNLTSLNLSSNRLSDVLPLTNLTNLTSLNLSSNRLSDVSPLANLTNLRRLELIENRLSSVSPLANLTNLTSLYLNDNQLLDVSPLANLTNLTVLFLIDNWLSDVSPLANLTNLTSLYLWNNHISDISPLVTNTGLGTGDTVGLQDNPLDDAAINTHIPALQKRGVTVDH